MARSFELLQREVDPDTALIPASGLAAEIGSPRFHGGLLQKRSAMMHMGRFGCGLAEAAARRGARIFESAPVTALKRRSDKGYDIATPRGRLQADQVLVATGAYTRGPFGYFRRRIVPVGSFIVATEPLAPVTLDAIMPTRRTATTTKTIGNYFRISPDDRLIFGGRARFALSNPQSDTKSGRILQAAMGEIFPQLGETRIDYCWGGLVDMTADRLPRAGQHDGLYYAMGYSGHGVQMSVQMGQIMAEVMNGRTNLNPWASLPWPAIPGHFGRPWFLPLVGAYYRAVDMLR
jgi:glycine/D-amino acid oxidase-like deaminating enzyme